MRTAGAGWDEAAILDEETIVIGTERHSIRTPEQVTIEYRLAGLGSRALAWLVDQMVQISLTVLSMRALGFTPAFIRDALAFILLFAMQAGYGIVLEWIWDGQTLGKKVLGIRVIDARGFPVSPLSVLIRNVFRWLDFIPVAYGVGGIAALLDRRTRRLGDLVAGTIVVSERRPPIPRPVSEGFSRPNSLDRPEIRRRALRRIPPALREFVLELLVRREALDDDARFDLFERTAQLLRSLLDLPEEAFLSGERLVEDVAALLYARGVERVTPPRRDPSSRTPPARGTP
jgi:uncharacterized RDD family membrane protein YckC